MEKGLDDQDGRKRLNMSVDFWRGDILGRALEREDITLALQGVLAAITNAKHAGLCGVMDLNSPDLLEKFNVHAMEEAARDVAQGERTKAAETGGEE